MDKLRDNELQKGTFATPIILFYRASLDSLDHAPHESVIRFHEEDHMTTSLKPDERIRRLYLLEKSLVDIGWAQPVANSYDKGYWNAINFAHVD